MTEHGILFSAPMVRALLNTKVGSWPPESIDPTKPTKGVTRRMSKQWLKVKAGDRLWVREGYGIGGRRLIDPCLNFRADGTQCPMFRVKPGWWRRSAEAFGVVSDEEMLKIRDGWIPSIHMPRWASRILLECLEDAREERLQDITEEEARLEGCSPLEVTSADIEEMCKDGLSTGAALALAMGPGMLTAKCEFMELWTTLHTKPGQTWAENPSLVRVGPFRRIA